MCWMLKYCERQCKFIFISTQKYIVIKVDMPCHGCLMLHFRMRMNRTRSKMVRKIKREGH
jgi:hypothetical protein